MFKISFDLLATKGNIGFYQRCEVIEIFLINKLDNSILNLYILADFQEESYKGFNLEFLTKKLIKINENYSLGIKKYYLSISDAKNRFNSLNDNKTWFFNNKSIEFDSLVLIPKQFVSLRKDNRLNNVLIKYPNKSSYILEFFNENKQFSFKNNLQEFNKICKIIKEILDLDFNQVPERLGNIIFQFPITLLDVNDVATNEWDGIHLSISWHNKLNSVPNCVVKVFSEYDGIILSDSTKILDNFDEEIFVVNNFGQNGVKNIIYDIDKNLILYSYEGGYLSNISVSADVYAPNDFREFWVNGNKEKFLVHDVQQIINPPTRDFHDFISSAVRNKEKIKLKNNLSFKQYPDNNLENPIEDLQNLIQKNDRNGVYLWDPYLDANSIFNTLFYSKSSNVPLRAITSGNVGKFEDIQRGFDINKDNIYKLNLEIRMQHGNYGSPFHDRFLIFPSASIFEESKVYSLGTSVNSFGKKHHILQLVSFPELIIDEFKKLWYELDNEECILWKTK